MIALKGKVRDEGNCGRAIDRGEEAREWVRKRRVCIISPPGPTLVQAVRLRTETSYKAGAARRVSTPSRSRSQTTDFVNDELVQRNITLLSGETCRDNTGIVAAPISQRNLGIPIATVPRVTFPCIRIGVLLIRFASKRTTDHSLGNRVSLRVHFLFGIIIVFFAAGAGHSDTRAPPKDHEYPSENKEFVFEVKVKRRAKPISQACRGVLKRRVDAELITLWEQHGRPIEALEIHAPQSNFSADSASLREWEEFPDRQFYQEN